MTQNSGQPAPSPEREGESTVDDLPDQGLLPWAKTHWTRIFANPSFALASAMPNLARAMWLLAARNWTSGPADDAWAVAVGIDPGHLVQLASMGLYRDGWLLWMRDTREEAHRLSGRQRANVCKRYVHHRTTTDLPKPTKKKYQKKKEKDCTVTPVESSSLGVDQQPVDRIPPPGVETNPSSQLGAEESNGHSKPRRSPGGTPLTRFWDEHWTRTRGVPYGWSTPDFVALAACSKLAGDDQAEVERRILALLESSERWDAQNATPRTLRSKWNSYAVKVVPLAAQQQQFIPKGELAVMRAIAFAQQFSDKESQPNGQQ